MEKQRQRAPSKRSLATRKRILDAAEQVFAARGFEGATLRDIAAGAGVQVGLVHHHGGGKEDLFRITVARRAEELSRARLQALDVERSDGPLTLRAILTAFFGPYLSLAATGPEWYAYARLVAHVSADPRWSEIAAACFDPTAQVFLDEIAALLPDRPRSVLATGFVFAVSAMLALLTSHWRIAALGKEPPDPTDQLHDLVTYCAAGFQAARGDERDSL